jgi:hypothetical protein
MAGILYAVTSFYTVTSLRTILHFNSPLSLSRVDEPTEDTTNKAVTIAHSTSHIYSYTHPSKLHCKARSRSRTLNAYIVVYEFSPIF